MVRLWRRVMCVDPKIFVVLRPFKGHTTHISPMPVNKKYEIIIIPV